MSDSKLKQLFQRIKTIKAEIAEKNEEIKDIYALAKGENIDVKVLRRIVREDKMDAMELAEHEHVYHQYRLELGMTDI